MKNCPHLGLLGDSDSRFLYATRENYCHKSDPVASVERSYQEAVCLVEAHRSCPVFQQEWQGALPQEARGRRARKPKRVVYLWLGIILVVIVLIGWGINVMLKEPERLAWFVGGVEVSDTQETQWVSVAVTDIPSLTSTSFTRTLSPTTTATETLSPTDTFNTTESPSETPTIEAIEQPSATSTDQNTLTPWPTFTASVVTATQTVTVLISPTPKTDVFLPAPKFQTPFGPQDSYVLHYIREGESFPLISNLYSTNNDVIIALNTWVAETGLWPNQVIVVMPGISDPQDVKPLSVHFTQTEMSVSEFAAIQRVTVDEVRFYNQFGEAESIPAGRWVIFPYQPETLTPLPAATPTPDLSKALVGLFGPHNEYVLHRIVAGESLPALERRYLTSAEVVRASNEIVGSLQIGQVLVIIPGHIELVDLVKFSVLQVEEAISVEALAADLGILYADIIYYNNLTQGDDIPSGYWIIYPFKEESP